MSTNETVAITNYSLAYSIKFAVLIALEIPSILVSLLIFIYFGYNRTAHLTPQNHSILVLLVINFLQVITDLPMPMSFFRLNGIVQPATSSYCTWWIWYEFSLNTTNGFLMAWISIERYILIFHSGFIRNLGIWKRKLLHIIPLVVCSLWGPFYYVVTIIISPMCTNTRYYDSLLCGLPCYLLTNWGTFDLFFDVIFPVVTIFVFNLLLFIRAVYQSMTVVGRVQNNWQRHRKMAFQLGLISFVYLAVWIPLSIAQLGEIYIDPNFLLEPLDTFNFLVYIVPLILPMICLMSMPELIQKLKTIIFRQRQAVIMPMNTAIVRRATVRHISMTNAIAKF
jgi:phosphatidylglycerophosphate synthase